MSEKLAVYAGTFDPLTFGHLWMIEQGALLFDHLHVAIGTNPEKKFMFSADERLALLQESTLQIPNVSRNIFPHQFLTRYAKSVGANIILRGIRNASDYEYERTMRNINGDLNSEITTVFLMPPREIAEISSSTVKGLLGPGGWEEIVGKYVPLPVLEKLKEVYCARENKTKVV